MDQSRSLPSEEGGLCPWRNLAQVYRWAIDLQKRADLGQVQTGTFPINKWEFVFESLVPAIVLITVEVEDLLAVHTEKTWENALRQASSWTVSLLCEYRDKRRFVPRTMISYSSSISCRVWADQSPRVACFVVMWLPSKGEHSCLWQVKSPCISDPTSRQFDVSTLSWLH